MQASLSPVRACRRGAAASRRRAEGAAHARPARARIEQPRQLGQRLRNRHRLDRLGFKQILELVDLAGTLVAPSQLRSTARRRRASSTPNSAARSTLVSTLGCAVPFVPIRWAPEPPSAIGDRAGAPGRLRRRLAREDLAAASSRDGASRRRNWTPMPCGFCGAAGSNALTQVTLPSPASATSPPASWISNANVRRPAAASGWR